MPLLYLTLNSEQISRSLSLKSLLSKLPNLLSKFLTFNYSALPETEEDVLQLNTARRRELTLVAEVGGQRREGNSQYI